MEGAPQNLCIPNDNNAERSVRQLLFCVGRGEAEGFAAGGKCLVHGVVHDAFANGAKASGVDAAAANDLERKGPGGAPAKWPSRGPQYVRRRLGPKGLTVALVKVRRIYGDHQGARRRGVRGFSPRTYTPSQGRERMAACSPRRHWISSPAYFLRRLQST